MKDLTLFLAENVGVEYVLIGHPSESKQDYVDTITLYAKGSIVPNMSYQLAGTPCENVTGRNCCYFPKGIQQMFPQDKELQELNIESYIGFPLFDHDRKPIGLIVLMDGDTIRMAGAIEDGLHELAERTSTELKKCRARHNESLLV